MQTKVKNKMRSIIATVCLAAAMGRPVVAAEDGFAQLVKNAHYWQERGRADRAAEFWTRVLQVDPSNAEALVELGTTHSRAGRLDRAREYLARLRQSRPDHPGVATLERAVATGVDYDQLVGRARQQARAGRSAEAVGSYRQAFGGAEPPDDLALEFYQTLGGTGDGWDEARRGLERLAGRTGGERARLALAQHLSYRERSRRQAIALLSGLAGEEARKAWRQALLWLQATPADGELYAAWLARNPADAEVARRAAASKTSAGRPAGSTTRAGFEALARQQVTEAARLFDRAALATAGRDPEVLVGQGVVALQQKDFGKARDIFTRVKAMAPQRRDLWERSLRSATFWTLVREAEAARIARRFDEAERKLADAAQQSPEEKIQAEVALAEVQAARGNGDRALTLLDQALAAEPRNAAALAALVRVHLAAGRLAEAEEANRRLGQLDANRAVSTQVLAVQKLRAEAAALRKAGQLDEARVKLGEAREVDASAPETLIDLGYLQLELGQPEEAGKTVEALARLAPQHPELTHLRVRLLEREGKTAEALDLLEKIPAPELDAQWRAVKEGLAVQLEVRTAVARAQHGAVPGSRLRLAELERRAAGRPALTLLVAEAWAEIGDRARAVSLATQISSRAGELDTGARLALSAVYLRAGRDAELDELLRTLASEPALSTRERTDLDRLRVAQAVRRADARRQKGELEPALDELAALLRESPENPRLLCALGRIYHAASENDEAQAAFMRVLQADPDDGEARQGAVETALASHDLDAARRLTDEGVQRAPQDPRAHLLAGRFAARTGADAAAAESLRRARELLDERRPTALALARGGTDMLGTGGLRLGRAARADDDDLAGAVQTEMDRLDARRSIEMHGEFQVRNRDGYGGLAGITELRMPVEARVPLGFFGHLGIAVTPVLLDTGAVKATPELSEQFGTLGLDPANRLVDGLGGTLTGAELALSLHHRWFTLDVGSTPLGLPLQAVVGGATVRARQGRVGLSASASRRAMTDSLLSYVGLRDPATGRTWGQVLVDSGRLDLSVDTESALFYLLGSYGRLQGTDVAANQMVTLGTGVHWSLYDFEDLKLASGLGVSYLGYGNNLRYFTLGQGGYFSPQRFVHVGVPLQARGEAGAFRWQASGDLGFNWFREDATSYFPTRPDLQLAREMVMGRDGAPAASVFPARSNLALSAEVQARGGYQLTPHMNAGFAATYRQADYFRELVGGVYLELSFRPRVSTRRPGL
jgi:tetratricopeptide (TPR) repeat protein